MRKISKSRVDDDVVSSTNGSLLNDDRAESPVNDANEKDAKSDDDSNADTEGKDSDADYSSKETKKSKSKSKAKKRKSTKDKPVEEEYEVEKVVGSKKIKGKLHYLIRWKGYDADNDTWEPENTLSCPDLISKYNEEKENSKSKTKEEKKEKKDKKGKKGIKRKGKRDSSGTPAKKTKSEWDSEGADENAEYEVERILEVHHKKNGKREFLIHWKGWSTKFDSWEPEENLNCPDLIKKFMDKVDAAKTSDSRNLRVAPETTNRYTLQAPSTGRRLSKRRGQRQRVRYDNAE